MNVLLLLLLAAGAASVALVAVIGLSKTAWGRAVGLPEHRDGSTVDWVRTLFTTGLTPPPEPIAPVQETDWEMFERLLSGDTVPHAPKDDPAAPHSALHFDGLLKGDQPREGSIEDAISGTRIPWLDGGVNDAAFFRTARSERGSSARRLRTWAPFAIAAIVVLSLISVVRLQTATPMTESEFMARYISNGQDVYVFPGQDKAEIIAPVEDLEAVVQSSRSAGFLVECPIIDDADPDEPVDQVCSGTLRDLTLAITKVQDQLQVTIAGPEPTEQENAA